MLLAYVVLLVPSPEELAEDMTPLFETIVDIVEPPAVDIDGPFQMQISSLDYNSFVGVMVLAVFNVVQ